MSSNEIEARIKRIENGLILQNEAALPGAPLHSLVARMERMRVPGISVAVMHNFEIEWVRSYGVKEAGKPAPITEETIFQAASISKAVNAVGVMRLVQDGLLDLDEDINAYLKTWKVPANNGWQPCITLRQLLSHTAGLTIHGFPGYAVDDPLPTVPQILNGETPSNTDKVYVDTVPGAFWRYSGGGTTITQQILVDVTGKAYPALMQELVFGPLEMKHSRYEHPLTEPYWDSAAVGHIFTGDPVRGKWRVHPELAAAGMWTTPHDLALFGCEIQKARAGKSTKILSQQSVEAMFVNHGDIAMEPGMAIGIGFFLRQSDKPSARFGHSGGNIGYRCNLIAYQDGSFGAAIMTNSDMGNVVHDELFNAIAAEYAWPDYVPEKRARIEADSTLLATYSGTYELKPGLALTLHVAEGTLHAQTTGQAPFTLYPASESKFYSDTLLGIELNFDKADEGSNQVTLNQGGNTLTGKKLS